MIGLFRRRGAIPWKELRHSRFVMIGLFFLLLLILLLFVLPVLFSLDPYTTDREAGFWAPPSQTHILGTDDVGRDIFARLVYGGRVSLLVGFASALLSMAIGIPMGLLAGYRRGKWEYWIMRLVDVFQSFPSMILILCLVALIGPSVWNIIFVIGGLGWASIARLTYGNTLSVVEKDYILAARALGARDREIILYNIFPNAVAPVWAVLPMRVGRAILSESGLSFLGVGLRTPEASWGNMLQSAMELSTLIQRPWMWMPPALCIIATVCMLLFVSEGLRETLNPKEKRWAY